MDLPILEVLDLIEEHVKRGVRGTIEEFSKALHQAIETCTRVDRCFQGQIEDVPTAYVILRKQAVNRVVDEDRLSNAAWTHQNHCAARTAVSHESAESG